MIDAVIDSVVGSLRLKDAILFDICIGAHIGRVDISEAVGQIDHFAHLSFLEQCGEVVTIELLNLPAYWWQLEGVFTCHGVRLHRHALALHDSGSLVTIATGVREGELACLLLWVQVIIDQP